MLRQYSSRAERCQVNSRYVSVARPRCTSGPVHRPTNRRSSSTKCSRRSVRRSVWIKSGKCTLRPSLFSHYPVKKAWGCSNFLHRGFSGAYFLTGFSSGLFFAPVSSFSRRCHERARFTLYGAEVDWVRRTDREIRVGRVA